MQQIEIIMIDNQTHVKFNCPKCGKEIIRIKYLYDMNLKRSKTGQCYCSQTCALSGRPRPDYVIKKMRDKQKGISVMSRGRKGRIISQEIKDKIRASKLGVPCPKDWEGMKRAMNDIKGNRKLIPLIKPVPDGILIDGDRVISIEVEKKDYEWGIRNKMAMYDNVDYFDEVIIIWYRDNARVCQFHKVNGQWNRED